MSAGRVVINTDKAPQAIGPYSQAIKYGDMLYLSGQIGLDPKFTVRTVNHRLFVEDSTETGELVSDDVSVQTQQALANMTYVLEAGGSNLASVVKTTVFLADLNDYAAVNKVYSEFFTSEPPARSAVQVAALPKNSKVEIEAISIAASPQPSNKK